MLEVARSKYPLLFRESLIRRVDLIIFQLPSLKLRDADQFIFPCPQSTKNVLGHLAASKSQFHRNKNLVKPDHIVNLNTRLHQPERLKIKKHVNLKILMTSQCIFSPSTFQLEWYLVQVLWSSIAGGYKNCSSTQQSAYNSR